MKKIMTIIAAAAVALTLVGCQMGNLDGEKKGTKKNLTVTVDNPGPSADLYKRGWKQLGTKETVQALETKITIDMTKATGKVTKGTDNKYTATETGDEVNAVIGLIFDLHETTVKSTEATTAKPAGKYYSFVLIGYQPKYKRYYIERFEDVAQDAFDKGDFPDAKEYITPTSSAAYYTPTSTTFVTEKTGKFPGDEDGNKASDADIALQELTVKITQATKGQFKINLGDKEWPYTPAANEAYTNKEGYRIGGAGYYVNCPVGCVAKANFNSKNDNTKGLNADEEDF